MSTLHSSNKSYIDHVSTESKAFSKSMNQEYANLVFVAFLNQCSHHLQIVVRAETRSKSSLFNRLVEVELFCVPLREDFHEQLVEC